MLWCPVCRRDVGPLEGTVCPTCGSEVESVASNPNDDDAAAEDRPAHLAVLDAKNEAQGAEAADLAAGSVAEVLSPRRRLVSTAGPSVPIRKQANDSVPSSWMQRLEAARVSRSGGDAGQSTKEPSKEVQSKNGIRPPPLKRMVSSNPGTPSGAQTATGDAVNKPAHLLLAQLEADEQRKQSEDTARPATNLFAVDRSSEIAKVEINLPSMISRKRKIPDWAIITLLAGGVLAVVGAVVVRTKEEPAPKVAIDPALEARAVKRREAMVAVEEGHRFALEGKGRADEAIQAYHRALSLEPTLAQAERGLAVAYATKDDDANAVRHYKSYLALKPEASDAVRVRKIIEEYEAKEKARSASPPAAPSPATDSGAKEKSKAKASSRHRSR